MTGSPAEIWRGVILAAGLFALPAAAQTLPESPPETPPYDAARPPSGKIEVNTLGAPDGPAAGLLDSSNNGLGSDIWSGSPRALIEELLAKLPLATPVHTVRTLARRVLLTKADSPVGQAPHAFQTVRLEALLDAGHVDDAAQLAAQIVLKDDAEFSGVQAEAILLGNRASDACGDATIARLSNPEPTWMQLRAYCYAISAQKDLLDLTRSVMKVQGTDDKPFEVLLDDVLKHKSADPGDIRDPTAVEVFLMRQVGLPVRANFAAKFGLAASMLALRDAKNTPIVRAAAAEQAVHTGAITQTMQGAIADVQSFSPQELADAASESERLPFFMGQALIRQAAAHETGDAAKAKLLAVAFRNGAKAAMLPIAAELQQDAAATIKPDAGMREFAAPVAQALLIARRADAAERWREILDVNSDGGLAAELAVELNLVTTNPGRAGRAQQGLAWLAQDASAPQTNSNTQHFAALAVALYDALGEAVPPNPASAWQGRDFEPIVKKRLEEIESEPERKGEALLTILDFVGAQGPGDLSPGTAATIVRILKAEGEGETARAFAADTLLLSGPAS